MIFQRDTWQEIFETIGRNKLRSFLAAFSVAWGIFILVILSAAGNGLQHGAQSQFANDAANSIWIDGGHTSRIYKGFKPNREIILNNRDYFAIRKELPLLDFGSGIVNGWGTKEISYKKERAGVIVRPVFPEHINLEKAFLLQGRFINQLDIEQYAKVCCIGIPIANTFFKKENPIGKYLDIERTKYKVVGVFDDHGNNDNYRTYIPVTTAQKAWNLKTNLNTIWVSTGTASLKESQEMTTHIKKKLAEIHHFDENDPDAVGIYNNNEEYVRVLNLLSGIQIFVTIMGMFTLFAGIVGVSNIMMIIVKERTKEIGIRKALGAGPLSLVGQIVLESIFLTGCAGYCGLISGVGIIEAIKSYGIDSDYFKNPDVNIGMAIFSTALLVVSGLVAGLVPGLRAAKIHPVEALRND